MINEPENTSRHSGTSAKATVGVGNGASTAVLELSRSNEEVEKRFKGLLEQWTEETRFESNYSRLMMHPAYRKILGLGPQVVPLILRNLTGGSGPWIAALEDITGENPILPGHETDSKLMIQDWLEWGKRHGIV
ncbi:MAG TPA: hypothetical protein VGN88_08160 [Phycisphaerae bacterium]